MSYYSERNGKKRVVERTYIITPDKYEFILDCCKRYYDYIAWKYPEHCPDEYYDCCGLDHEKLNTAVRFEIPSLFRDSRKNIAVPSAQYLNPFHELQEGDDYDQNALLDFVELVGQNIRDIKERKPHPFFRHYDFIYADTCMKQSEFRKDINHIFTVTGLLYQFTEKMEVERIEEFGVATEEIHEVVHATPEPDTQKLLGEAIQIHKGRVATSSRDACERIWDALERLKTFYKTLDKKASATKIVKDMSGGQAEFEKLFNDEFLALSNIGNSFRIRHHETDKVDIRDSRHYDYFFNRCLSLIATAVQYLK